MTTKRQVLTPLAVGQAVELSAGSGLWKKQILPVRKVNYKGRVLDFNRRYFTELSNSFKRRAFDQVPTQIADGANKHNNDPRNFGGKLVDLAVEEDGLYGIFQPSKAGAQILDENPEIGVSARILEGYQRSDGASFGKALQHVLLTVDPHIPNMKPWEKVAELSADEQPEDTVDLSSDTEEEEMPQTKEQHNTDGDATEVVTLSREEYDVFREMAAERAAALEFAADLDPADFEDEEEDEDQPVDEEGGGSEGGDGGAIPESVRLTMEAQSNQILELTNQARAREVEAAVRELRREGLAPSIVEAARPLLGMVDQTIELSNGEDLNVGEAVGNLLQAVVDLARNGEALVRYDVELGRTDETDPIEARRAQLLDAWDQAVGE
jgi:hypothetical protein